MLNESEWEKFQGGPAGGPHVWKNRVRVTINRKGCIYLNAKAYQVFGKPKAVALYYNRAEDWIAVQHAYERFEHNFVVVKKQNGFAIHASSFCRHYKIAIDNTARFIRPDLDNSGNLILDLRQTANVGGIRKKKGWQQAKR